MTSAVTLLHPASALSIQGEHQLARERVHADQDYVDEYAASCSDGVASCRGRRRHDYPDLPRHDIDFDEVTEEGLLVRYEVCKSCGCAVQKQFWEAFEVRQRGRKETRFREFDKYTVYQINEHGEEYVAKGHGFIPTKKFREAIATRAAGDAAKAWAKDAMRVRRKVAASGVGVRAGSGSS